MMELLLNAENALALGLLDSAERTYRTVLETDPRNGIAAVGLSRVALERGDEAGAVALAQAALEIDPENATARRMIDRLEEVARFRDDAVGVPAAAAAAAPISPRAADAVPPGVAVDSEAMIRASGNVGGELDGRSAAPTAIGRPDSAIGRPDSAIGRPDSTRRTHAEIAAGTVERAPATSAAAVSAACIGSEQESSTQRQRPGGAADPPGIQPGGAADPPGIQPGAAADPPGIQPGAAADPPGIQPGAAADPLGIQPGAAADPLGIQPGAAADPLGIQPGAAAPAAPAAAPDPNDAQSHPLPARPGLLWRILRRS